MISQSSNTSSSRPTVIIVTILATIAICLTLTYSNKESVLTRKNQATIVGNQPNALTPWTKISTPLSMRVVADIKKRYGIDVEVVRLENWKGAVRSDSTTYGPYNIKRASLNVYLSGNSQGVVSSTGSASTWEKWDFILEQSGVYRIRQNALTSRFLTLNSNLQVVTTTGTFFDQEWVLIRSQTDDPRGTALVDRWGIYSAWKSKFLFIGSTSITTETKLETGAMDLQILTPSSGGGGGGGTDMFLSTRSRNMRARDYTNMFEHFSVADDAEFGCFDEQDEPYVKQLTLRNVESALGSKEFLDPDRKHKAMTKNGKIVLLYEDNMVAVADANNERTIEGVYVASENGKIHPRAIELVL